MRVNGEYSSWIEIIFGVPQDSILGPLIFNIYVGDYFLFVENSDIASYADDNTPYSTAEQTDVVINNLEKESKMLLQWLKSNYLKANPDKFRLLLNNKFTNLYAMINNHVINNSEQMKLLRITLDNDLTFNMHVSKLCKKASQKVHALSRVCHYMTISQRRIIMKAFIESQFGYCPLVWMPGQVHQAGASVPHRRPFFRLRGGPSGKDILAHNLFCQKLAHNHAIKYYGTLG